MSYSLVLLRSGPNADELPGEELDRLMRWLTPKGELAFPRLST